MSKKDDREPSKLESPTDDFCEWWYPYGRDPESGAHIGGHPESERVWARKDPGRWVRRTYGITARIAYNTAHYRGEYEGWVNLGRPRRKPFISLAATNTRQLQFWRDLMPIYQWAFVGKSIPKADLDPLVEEMMRKYPGYDPSA
jgi:hypothetical protein